MTCRKQAKIRRETRLISAACQDWLVRDHSLDRHIQSSRACTRACRGDHKDVIINLVLAKERGSKVREPRGLGQLFERLALQRVVRLQTRACVHVCVRLRVHIH